MRHPEAAGDTPFMDPAVCLSGTLHAAAARGSQGGADLEEVTKAKGEP